MTIPKNAEMIGLREVYRVSSTNAAYRLGFTSGRSRSISGRLAQRVLGRVIY